MKSTTICFILILFEFQVKGFAFEGFSVQTDVFFSPPFTLECISNSLFEAQVNHRIWQKVASCLLANETESISHLADNENYGCTRFVSAGLSSVSVITVVYQGAGPRLCSHDITSDTVIVWAAPCIYEVSVVHDFEMTTTTSEKMTTKVECAFAGLQMRWDYINSTDESSALGNRSFTEDCIDNGLTGRFCTGIATKTFTCHFNVTSSTTSGVAPGIYKIKASLLTGEDEFTGLYLVLSTAITVPDETDFSVVITPSPKVTVIFGQTLTLTCHWSPNYTFRGAYVQFRRNNDPGVVGTLFMNFGSVCSQTPPYTTVCDRKNRTLQLKVPTSNYKHGDSWTCEGQNEKGENIHMDRTTVYVTGALSVVVSPSPTATVVSGQTLRLTCQWSPGYTFRGAYVQFRRNNDPGVIGTLSFNFGTGCSQTPPYITRCDRVNRTLELLVPPSNYKHGDTWRCESQNERKQEIQTDRSVVQIDNKTDFSVAITPSPKVTVISGQTLMLTCHWSTNYTSRGAYVQFRRNDDPGVVGTLFMNFGSACSQTPPYTTVCDRHNRTLQIQVPSSNYKHGDSWTCEGQNERQQEIQSDRSVVHIDTLPSHLSDFDYIGFIASVSASSILLWIGLYFLKYGNDNYCKDKIRITTTTAKIKTNIAKIKTTSAKITTTTKIATTPASINTNDDREKND